MAAARRHLLEQGVGDTYALVILVRFQFALERVSFPGCTLTGADFTKATCTEVDLRGAQLGITGGYESLRGVTIDSVQLVSLAPYLARHLGITVKD